MIISVLDFLDFDLMSAGAVRGRHGFQWRLAPLRLECGCCYVPIKVRDRVLGCVHVIVQSVNE